MEGVKEKKNKFDRESSGKEEVRQAHAKLPGVV